MEIKRRNIEIAMAVTMLTALCFICLGVRYLSVKEEKSVRNEGNIEAKQEEEKTDYVVMLDAGHGGKDPGKVGVNGAIESEINLEIVLLLKDYLEEQGIAVILTRVNENGLYKESDTNKKRSDMIKRCELVNEAAPDMLVSIHQNSYSSEGVKGAQTFYYKNSKDGEAIAGIIQRHIKDEVDSENGREHKENSNYYILKNVECPAVIVECGFLSNYSEAELLVSKEYQEKMARAIGNGVLEYLKGSRL